MFHSHCKKYFSYITDVNQKAKIDEIGRILETLLFL